ncbi:DRMBL-domain-containing protein, partial [Anaeromyces robustus]
YIQDTNFVVDAFTYGKIDNCTAYFLSHFHSDHYGGITSKFNYGPIYCSKVTSNLLIELLKVDEQYVHALELNKEYIIDGVKVTLIDANHCPGAVLFLFNVPIGNNQYFNALHTGDFRANIEQLTNPAIKKLRNSSLDVLYLDTTYLKPEHLFPSQEVVINSVLNVLKLLILVGTYLIGKEKVFLGIAKFLKSKLYTSSKKKKILECLNDNTISMLLTDNPDEACVHILNMGQLSIDAVNNYYNIYKDKYDSVIAFRPTGWVYKPKRGNKKKLEPDSKMILEELNNLKLKPTYYNRNVSIWGIPYSEHSSFIELENFIRVLSSITSVRNIIPTVNVGSFYNQSEESRKYWYWFDTWRRNPLFL